jgi:hypothetical protein
MLKIVVAMIIGAGLGAAVTHSIMSAHDDGASPSASSAAIGPASAQNAIARSQAPPAASAIAEPSPTALLTSVALGSASRPVPQAVLTGQVPATGGIAALPRAAALISDSASLEEALALVFAGDDADPLMLDALQGIPERWLSESPREVIAVLDRIGTSRHRQMYLAELTRVAVMQRPELLPEIAAHLRGLSEQGSVMNGFMQGLQFVEDPEALLGVAESLPGMLSRGVERMVYSQIASRDPLDALARAEALPPGETRQMLTTQSIMQLATRDPAGALAWLDGHRSSVDSNLYSGVATAVSQHDPQLAARYAPSVPEAARGAWIAAVARGMATTDVDAALNWLAPYRNTAYYSDAVAGVAQQVGGFDPPRAALLLDDIDLASPQGRATVAGLAAMWGGSDPAAAEAWARSLPRGEVRDRALMALAPRIGEPLLEDATLGLFSSEQMREAAAGAAITAIARTEPQRAQQLVNAHITNPQLAQELGSIIADGGPAASIMTFAAPVAVGVAPMGETLIYRNVGAGGLPQLTVNGDVTSFVLSAPDPQR